VIVENLFDDYQMKVSKELKEKTKHAMKFFKCGNRESLKSFLIQVRSKIPYFDVKKAEEVYDPEMQCYGPNQDLKRWNLFNEITDVIVFLDSGEDFNF
jgi:hypothetical protein